MFCSIRKAVALLLLFCLKLKSGPFKRIFPIIQKPYICVCCNSAMAGPSDAMIPERFVGGNFRRWQTRVKFWLMSMELWWVIHLVMPFTVEQTATFAGVVIRRLDVSYPYCQISCTICTWITQTPQSCGMHLSANLQSQKVVAYSIPVSSSTTSALML